MTHVVTGRCVKCRYTDCCAVCPVDCFYEVQTPAMLVIDPDGCIDCTLCVPECPIQAIWSQDELPNVYQEWLDQNRELVPSGVNIKEKKDALDGALSLADIQNNERAKGWSVKEPTGAKYADTGGLSDLEAIPVNLVDATDRIRVSDPLPPPEGLTGSQARVFDATANTIYTWRTAQAIAKQTALPEDMTQADLDALVALGHVLRQETTSGKVHYAAAKRTQ